MGLWRITANKVQEIFGSRIAKKWNGVPNGNPCEAPQRRRR